MKWIHLPPPPPPKMDTPQKKRLPPNRMDTPPKTILYTIHNYDTNIPPYANIAFNIVLATMSTCIGHQPHRLIYNSLGLQIRPS